MEVEGTGAFPRLAEEPFNLVILDGADEIVKLFCLRFRGGDGGDFMFLGEQDGKAQSNISYSGNCDLHIVLSPYS
jgi:hypothetical protein